MIDRIDGKGQEPMNADNAAALAALRRAAVIARRRALAVSGYVVDWEGWQNSARIGSGQNLPGWNG